MLASIAWDVSTWFIDIPLSSSHTLIGAIIGGSRGFAYFCSGKANWEKAKEIKLSLFSSPIIGLAGSYFLMYAEKEFIHTGKLFYAPDGDNDKPPLPIMFLLITICTLDSFFHGSNDGQKGVGLLMLILIAFLPARFMINENIPAASISTTILTTSRLMQEIAGKNATDSCINSLITKTATEANNINNGTTQQRFAFRKDVQKITAAVKAL